MSDEIALAPEDGFFDQDDDRGAGDAHMTSRDDDGSVTMAGPEVHGDDGPVESAATPETEEEFEADALPVLRELTPSQSSEQILRPVKPGYLAGKTTTNSWADPGRLVVDTGSFGQESVPVPQGYSKKPAYRPDSALDGYATQWWVVRAASTRGDDHRNLGVTRQDDFAMGWSASGALAIAVADGVSQCPESHHAAIHTTRKAVDLLLNEVENPTGDERGPDKGVNFNNIVDQCAYLPVALTQNFFGLPEPDPELAQRLMSCTLTFALLIPEADGLDVQVVTIGDSAVGILNARDIQRIQGGKDSQGGLTSAAVSGLPLKPNVIEVLTARIGADEVFLMGSDGIWDPLGDGSGAVGDMLRQALITPPDLMQFGRVTDFSRETWTDDRTLIAVWPSTIINAQPTRSTATAGGPAPARP